MVISIPTPQGTRSIGAGHPALIVAELSGNHCQSLSRAKALIQAAAEAGVDAIKLQTYTADTLTINSSDPLFQITTGLWRGMTLYELYQIAYTPWEWHAELMAYAKSLGLISFSTPFDETAVDFLEQLDVPLYKVASFSNDHLPLLKAIGKTKKPVLLSRGLTDIKGLQLAITTLKEAGSPLVIPLHCTSAYPTPFSEVNLRTIPDMQERFNCPVGLSDHTLGPETTLGAITLNACVIEKHFTLARSEGGPDAAFSIEPSEMQQLVQQIRHLEAALGHADYSEGTEEKQSIIFKQSLFVVEDIEAGTILNKTNLRIIRPGFGLSPTFYEKVLGKKVKKALKRGTPLSLELIE